MPCYTERTVTVQITAESMEHLKSGLERADWQVVEVSGSLRVVSPEGISATITNGRVQVTEGNEHIVADIKRIYAQEVVTQTAKRYGWAVQFDRHDQQKMTLKRR